MYRGWIALDIDGTVTEGLNPVPEETSACLSELQAQGWRIVFITGRTFSFAQKALHVLGFPYYLALQNGADILLMPEKKILDQRYLDKSDLRQVELAYQGQGQDFLVYAGYEKGDFCYYRPNRFSREYLDYFEQLMQLAADPWQEVDSFDSLSKCSLIKCLGPEKTMRHLEEKLCNNGNLEVITIRDPLNIKLHCLLITNKEASKGCVIERLTRLAGGKRENETIIACGDDRNDLSMFGKADIRIVMNTAPKEVLRQADILAKPAKERGIISALLLATSRRDCNSP